MSDTYEKVKQIVVELMGVDESKVTPEATFRGKFEEGGLEADSLDLVELIMKFEDEFGADISDDDAQKITTVAEAVKYIDDHMPDSAKDETKPAEEATAETKSEDAKTS